MKDRVYQWIDANQASDWKCKHIQKAIEFLEDRGNSIQKMGLVNYRSPEAFFFLGKPINTEELELLMQAGESLSFRRNKLTEVLAVACEKDYVTLIYEP
ncbi:MAG TPA: hypothetical protein VN030_09035 [Cellvibrio sp.]|nr:hypothetical protein [Cellvibrio sp.]